MALRTVSGLSLLYNTCILMYISLMPASDGTNL